MQAAYNNALSYYDYVADALGITAFVNDESLCQTLEALPSYPSALGVLTGQKLVKYLLASSGVYIIYRATKSIAFELNRRYIRARHWIKLHEWSSTQPELYILVPLHSLLSPMIYFHYLFTCSWTFVCSYHKATVHSHHTYSPLSIKWKTWFTISCIPIVSYLYWHSWTEWTTKQLFNRNLSLQSWTAQRALESIEIEEHRWREVLCEILYDRFEDVHALCDVVMQFIGDSDVFKTEQQTLLRSKYVNEKNYANHRRAMFRQQKYTLRFRRYTNMITCCILSVQSMSYSVLVCKVIMCENDRCEKYYRKLYDWHDQFNTTHEDNEWRMERWMKSMVQQVWLYLFVDHRVPFSKYIVSVTDYVLNMSVSRQRKRIWKESFFFGSIWALWGRIHYLIVEEMARVYL